MNTSKAASILTLLLSASANAQVIVGTNLEFHHNPLFPASEGYDGYFANVYWTPSPHQDLTWSVGIEYDGHALRGDIDPSANGNGTFYLMQPGDVLSHQTFGQYPALTHTPIAVPSGDLFLGLRMALPENIFGWVHLRPGQDGLLRVVNNAMAYRTTGIVVGTTQVVPEPATILVAAICILLFAVRRRLV